MKDKLWKFPLGIASLFLYMFFLVITLSVICSIFNIGVNLIVLPFSVVVACVLLFIDKRFSTLEKIIMIIIFLVLFALTVLIASKIYSMDYDGSAYHKLAVGFLKNGWNPMYESPNDFRTAYFSNESVPSGSPWLESYGKATWYFAANLYKLTGTIESGKAYNLIGILVIFFLVLAFFYRKFEGKHFRNIMMAFLIAFNPVSISQMLSYYEDGFMGSMTFALIIGLLMLNSDGYKKLEAWAIIFPSMTILGNIKFTGLGYGGLFCIVFYLFSVIYKFDKNNKKTYGLRCVNFAFTAIFTVAIVGLSTYVTNVIRFMSPFYPFMGPGKIDVLTQQSPAGFEGKGRLFKYFYGLFSQTENLNYRGIRPLPMLKFPFTTSAEEISRCVAEDVRIGGNGVFFSGLLIIGAFIFILFVAFRLNDRKFSKEDLLIITLVLSIIAMALIISESWWARYAPQTYLLAVIPLYIVLFNERKRVWLYSLPAVFLLVVNNSIWFGYTGETLHNSTIYTNQFKELKELSPKTMELINDWDFAGAIFDLEDNGIQYSLTFDENAKAEHNAYYNMYKYNIK